MNLFYFGLVHCLIYHTSSVFDSPFCSIMLSPSLSFVKQNSFRTTVSTLETIYCSQLQCCLQRVSVVSVKQSECNTTLKVKKGTKHPPKNMIRKKIQLALLYIDFEAFNFSGNRALCLKENVKYRRRILNFLISLMPEILMAFLHGSK